MSYNYATDAENIREEFNKHLLTPINEEIDWINFYKIGDKVCKLQTPSISFYKFEATLLDSSQREEHDDNDNHDEFLIYEVRNTETGTTTFIKVRYGYSSYGGAYFYGTKIVQRITKTINVWE
jgi:hypothetical protein